MSTPSRWWEQTLQVIDFEGTRRSGIIEYGLVTLQGGTLAGVHTGLCRATGPVRAADRRTHGLRGDEGLEPFADPVRYAWWVARRREGIFAAHHASVEAGLLAAAWPYPPFSPDWRRPGHELAAWGPWLDSRRLAEAAWPGQESYGLGALITALNLQDTLDDIAHEACPAGRRRYHCALYDALASALLLRAAAEVEALRDLPLPRLLGDEPTEAWW